MKKSILVIIFILLNNSIFATSSIRFKDGEVIKLSNYFINNKTTICQNLNATICDAVVFSKLLEEIGTTSVTIIIDKDVYLNTAQPISFPINENTVLKFINGNTIKIGKTSGLVINGIIDAGLFQIFEVEGSINKGKINGNPKILYAYPQWFGAKSTKSNNRDDYRAIQLTLNFFKDTFFPTGDYYISKHLEIPHNYATLIGAGLKSARIQTTSNFKDFNMLQNFKGNKQEIKKGQKIGYNVYQVKIENLHFMAKENVASKNYQPVICINLIHMQEGGVIRDTYFSSTQVVWNQKKPIPNKLGGQTAIKILSNGYKYKSGNYDSLNVFLIENCVNYGHWNGTQIDVGSFGHSLTIDKYTFSQSYDSFIKINGISKTTINDCHFEYCGWINDNTSIINTNNIDALSIKNCTLWNDGGFKKKSNNKSITAIYLGAIGSSAKSNSYIIENISFIGSGYLLGFETYIDDKVKDRRLTSRIKNLNLYTRNNMLYTSLNGKLKRKKYR